MKLDPGSYPECRGCAHRARTPLAWRCGPTGCERVQAWMCSWQRSMPMHYMDMMRERALGMICPARKQQPQIASARAPHIA